MADTVWFSKARFGMFIHWGLYSNPGGIWKGKKIARNYSEWLQASECVPRDEYRSLAEDFNPTEFDADEWIREAQNAGMRYFLITAKHHDGFCLWPTNFSDYHVANTTPFKRDILGELAAACRRHDMKLGFYYSHWMDWDGSGGDVWYESDVPAGTKIDDNEYQHPSQEEFESYWLGKCLPQVGELIANYDPAFLWFDSWGTDSSQYITPTRQEELIRVIRRHSDHCMINSRINFEAPSENCDYLSMMDNCFPQRTFDKPWETSGTLNESWAYHQRDYNWKSTEQLLKHLVGNASLGGNYQLNVGPMPNGKMERAAVRRLREIGCWLSVNGESIYYTSASSLPAMPWGKITIRQQLHETIYYLHLWQYTPGTSIFIPGLKGSLFESHVLETGQPLATQASESGTFVSVPREVVGLNLPVLKIVAREVE